MLLSRGFRVMDRVRNAIPRPVWQNLPCMISHVPVSFPSADCMSVTVQPETQVDNLVEPPSLGDFRPCQENLLITEDLGVPVPTPNITLTY